MFDYELKGQEIFGFFNDKMVKKLQNITQDSEKNYKFQFVILLRIFSLQQPLKNYK